MVNQTENHKKFLKHLRESDDAVHKIKNWLEQGGCIVTKPENTEAKTQNEWKNHVDSGDLFVNFMGKDHVIEVKRLSIFFTSKDDWVFGTKFIVCEKNSFDRRIIKPFMYIILNKNMTHIAVVMEATKNNWYIEKRTDKRYDNVTQEFYLVPLEYVKWYKL